MGNSLGKFCVCALLTTAVCTVLAAQEGARSEVLIEADYVSFNKQTSLYEWRRPRIVQGNVHIEADESVAAGDNFEQNIEWKFKGHVKMTVDTAVLEASSAVFVFDHNQLTRADFEGVPASFTDLNSKQETPVRGGAHKLAYDHVGRTLRLSADAWINKAQFEIRGCELTYDFKEQRWASGPTDCGGDGVQIRIPQKSKQPAPPPAAPPQ